MASGWVVASFSPASGGLRGLSFLSGFLYRNQAAGYAQWMQRFISKGGIFFDPDSMEPKINSEQGVEALEEMNQLNQHTSRETITGSRDVLYTRFTQGKAAVTMAWRGDISAEQALDQTAQSWRKTTVHLGVLPQKRAWNFEIQQYAKPAPPRPAA